MADYNRLFRSPSGVPMPSDTWQLTPQGEQLYQQQTQGRQSDDYDLRGAWAQQGGGDLGEGHLTDEWKLPNHATFSAFSRYQTPQQQGGNWVPMPGPQWPGQQWAYYPSETNVQNMGTRGLQDYFGRVEPNNFLLTR
jgi:hypothetical protein